MKSFITWNEYPKIKPPRAAFFLVIHADESACAFYDALYQRWESLIGQPLSNISYWAEFPDVKSIK